MAGQFFFLTAPTRAWSLVNSLPIEVSIVHLTDRLHPSRPAYDRIERVPACYTPTVRVYLTWHTQFNSIHSQFLTVERIWNCFKFDATRLAWFWLFNKDYANNNFAHALKLAYNNYINAKDNVFNAIIWMIILMKSRISCRPICRQNRERLWSPEKRQTIILQQVSIINIQEWLYMATNNFVDNLLTYVWIYFMPHSTNVVHTAAGEAIVSRLELL